MIKIVADNYVKEECKEEFLALAKELVAETLKEEGNISYTLNEDLSDPLHLTFIEQWKDSKAIRQHNASAHFTTIVPKLHELTAKEGKVTLYNEIG